MEDCNRVKYLLFPVALCAVVVAADACAQDRPAGTVLEKIRFYPIPKNKPWRYLESELRPTYGEGGRCRLGADFTKVWWGFRVSWGGRFSTGDVVGVLGGVFRADCGEEAAYFERIAEKDFPKGVKEPRWDSGTVPLGGSLVFGNSAGKAGGYLGTKFEVLKMTGGEPKDANAELALEHRSGGPTPEVATVTVKAGDYVLIKGKGHLVRAVIPPNKETRVVGWVEISAEPIPEADLRRDKKSVVRPNFDRPGN